MCVFQGENGNILGPDDRRQEKSSDPLNRLDVILLGVSFLSYARHIA